jgi:hypothetical protein
MTDLRVVPFTPKPAEPEFDLKAAVVAKLRDLLAQAERGEILAFAGAYETAEHWRSVRVTDTCSNAIKMLAIAMHDFQEQLRS